MIYDRKNKLLTSENETDTKVINFLYKTTIGNFILKHIVCKRNFSKILSIYYNSRLSKRKIRKYAEIIGKKGINIDKYKSFNDYFCREESIDIIRSNLEQNILIAPAQSKLMIYNIECDGESQIFKIKQGLYTIRDIICQNTTVRNQYCLVFRLATTDYHRFINIDNGRLVAKYEIDGKLHTVRDIAHHQGYKVYTTNHRIVSIYDTDNLGRITYVEIGALTVGKIVDYGDMSVTKGKEKGYFKYGGSTIILFIENDKVVIDKDIIQQSKLGNETIVNIGEKIGEIMI